MEYTIIIKNETDIENESPIAGQSAPVSNEPKKSRISANDIGFYVAYKKVKPFVSQLVSNEVQKVGLRSGSNRMQEKANFMHSVLTSTISFGESVGIGAKVGGVWGAVGGALLSGAHKLITYSHNQNMIDLNASIENQSIRMINIRAGTLGSRRQ